MKEIIKDRIDGAKIICFTTLDHRHTRTNKTTHYVGGKVLEDIFGLAICKYEDVEGYYLFYCDHTWSSITDTFHETLEDAKDQAEFEFANTSNTWQTIDDNKLNSF